ncbi:acyl-CoA N-acyltransferase [Rhexocercosporidium sp. MPI-PUGE-AT-0058]|nr:acyl-CoA N-acyltransferase [Rhexocercosporidium sp. MPI-PUGE-AT-0058]
MENVFRSERLIYRAIEDTPEDEEFMHLIQSDPVAFSNSDNGILAPMTRKESGAWKKSVQTNKLIGVIICLAPPPSNPALPPDTKPSPPTPIGCIALTGLKPGYFQHRNSYISIDITAPYQRKGYGSEAIRWVLDWGFRIAGLHRIGIECFSYNVGARELYEDRLGFVFEGRKRELLWHNGGWHDMFSFSMLESEWKKLVQES